MLFWVLSPQSGKVTLLFQASACLSEKCIRISVKLRRKTGCGLDEITTATWPRAQEYPLYQGLKFPDLLLTWLAGKSHPLHHSKILGAPGVQIAAALQVAWQREFPRRCGPPHQHYSRRQGSPVPSRVCGSDRAGWVLACGQRDGHQGWVSPFSCPPRLLMFSPPSCPQLSSRDTDLPILALQTPCL